MLWNLWSLRLSQRGKVCANFSVLIFLLDGILISAAVPKSLLHWPFRLLFPLRKWFYCPLSKSRDSSVGIATGYGLDGPGIESRWGRDFSQPFRPAYPVSYKMDSSSFPGVKRPGLGVDHPTLSSAEVEKRVQLYLYSHSGPLWPVLGWNLIY